MYEIFCIYSSISGRPELVLTGLVVVVKLHHSVLYVGHFVISEEWESDANLGLGELQMGAEKSVIICDVTKYA